METITINDREYPLSTTKEELMDNLIVLGESAHKIKDEPIQKKESHYLTPRNHLKDLKYHIEALKRLAPGSPTLAIKEMQYEAGLRALSE